MNVVYLLDPKTQVGYPIEATETSIEALDRKEHLQLDYPENLFYYNINVNEYITLYSIEEALTLVSGKKN